MALVSIRQEFFAAMYLSNSAAIVKHQSDSLIRSLINESSRTLQEFYPSYALKENMGDIENTHAGNIIII